MESPTQDDLRTVLLSIVRQIGLLPEDLLAAHLQSLQQQNTRAESFGPILDPTGYRDALQNGTMEQARLQMAIIELILEIKKLGTKHDKIVKDRYLKNLERREIEQEALDE